MIRTEGLITGYSIGGRKKVITKDLSLTLNRGEMVALLGPNGAGKSTLMRTIAGFIKPLKGKVLVDGHDLTKLSNSELARLLGVVLTDRLQVDNMDVKTLVSMGRAPYTGYFGRLSTVDRQAIDNAIALVGVESLAQRNVMSLSDGERQKVMIAKALAQETPVILLDEPTAFLDYPSKVEIMQLLHRLASETGKLIFMSTHDLDLAMQIADTLWLIDRTLGVTGGTHSELVDNGSLERYFLRPGITFDRNSGLFRIKQ